MKTLSMTTALAAILAVLGLSIPATEQTKFETTIFETQPTPVPVESNPTPGWRRWRINGLPVEAIYRGTSMSGNIILELRDGTTIQPRPEHCDVLSLNGSPLEE